MKQLEQNFIGRGEVKGFHFTQINKSDLAYLYEVNCDGSVHYEVFKHKENKQFNCVSYPKTGSFGVWAWTVKTMNEAVVKFELLSLNNINE